MKTKLKKFKADFTLKLSPNLDVKMFLDADIESLLKEGYGAGEKYIKCRVRFYEAISDEYCELEYFFPLETKFSSLRDMFVNELWLITRRWKSGCYFDAVTDSNPEIAWIFYKKTFDSVMKGEEIWKNSSFTAEIVCELPDGKEVVLRHLEDDTERLFLNGEYLGRVSVCSADAQRIVYCDIDMNEGLPFFCNTKREKKYPGAVYKPFLSSKTMFVESGIQIQHTGSFHEIVTGMEAAVAEFMAHK